MGEMYKEKAKPRKLAVSRERRKISNFLVINLNIYGLGPLFLSHFEIRLLLCPELTYAN